jgi:hypothetical protein
MYSTNHVYRDYFIRYVDVVLKIWFCLLGPWMMGTMGGWLVLTADKVCARAVGPVSSNRDMYLAATESKVIQLMSLVNLRVLAR